MNRTEFLEQLAPERELTINTSSLGSIAENLEVSHDTVAVEGNPLSADGYHSLCDRAGVPVGLVKKLPKEMVQRMVQHLLHEDETPVNVITQQDEIVGIGRNTHSPITNARFFDEIERVIGEADEIVHISSKGLSLRDTNFTVVSPQSTEPRVGDISKSALRVFNSIMGDYNPRIELTLYRLVCLNGMVSPANVRTIGVRTVESLPEVIRAIWGESQNFLNNWRDTDQVRLGDRLDVMLPALFRQMRVPTRAQRSIMERVNAQRPETLYDLLNHVTWVGTHALRGEVAGDQLQQIAGAIVGDFSICEGCHRPTLAGAH